MSSGVMENLVIYRHRLGEERPLANRCGTGVPCASARSDLTESGRALQVIVRRIIFPSAGIQLTE